MRDSLEELLARGATLQDESLHSPELTKSMDAVWLAARSEAGLGPGPDRQRSKIRRRVTAAVVGLMALGAGVSGGPAFADWVGLHTGNYDTGPLLHRSPKTPDREYWRMDSPELVPHLRAWEQDYPLAPGYSLDPLIDNYAQREDTQMEAAGFRTDVFLYSECTWIDVWVKADRTGDTAARNEATQGLAATVAKLDRPAPIDLDEPGRAFLVQLVGAAREGDANPLQQEHRINCDWQFR